MSTPTRVPPPYPPLWPRRPASRRPVVAGALVLGGGAALLLPDGPPGAGLVLLAALTAVVLLRLRDGERLSPWQWVHGSSAVLLIAAAALLDADWVVALDLLAAAPLTALALAPTGTWTSVLLALPRLGLRAPSAVSALLRGLPSLRGQRRPRAIPGPGAEAGAHPPGARRGATAAAVRGLVTAAFLLAVFVPLLSSADGRFAALVGHLPHLALRLPDLELPARLFLLVVGAGTAAAMISVLREHPRALALPAATRLVRHRSEWLLPLGALDAVFALFLVVAATEPGDAAATYADQVHAGFGQLVAATALVLAVLAAAVRWTAPTPGVRAALGALCLLTLVVDASAASRLVAYVHAYGLTRLRVCVAVVSVVLAAVLVVLVVAGARRRPGRPPKRWVPHTAVLVAAVAMLAATAADPDAAIARSALARGQGADTAYLATLSADAVPALLALPRPARDCVLGSIRERSQTGPWTSANASRLRAAHLLRDQPAGSCPAP